MQSVPVHWKIKPLIDAHGITPYRLMKESGLAQGTVYRLVHGDTSTVNAETLDRVMTTLRRLTGKRVEIADLLEYREPE
jgi:predicted transcriptional regulator